MVAWVGVGKLLMPNYGETPASAAIRSNMESGPPKQAKRFSKVLVTRPVVYQFTPTEFDSFKTWFSGTVSLGVDWFDWTDPQDGVLRSARIVNGDYSAGAFAAPGEELRWRVSMQFETWSG